jgi:hypothetical protein
MTITLNGTIDPALTERIRTEAQQMDALGASALAAPMTDMLTSTSEQAYATAFIQALHHYTSVPYARAEQIALATPAPTRSPLTRLFRKLADRLLHARILPLWRWLLWRQGSLNRTLADALRFEHLRAHSREQQLSERIAQLEERLAEVERSGQESRHEG